MSKSNVFENDLLKLIFNATPIAGLADNAASSPVTNLYLALHTADPGEAGDQTTSEISYTGYTRLAVLRTSGGWTWRRLPACRTRPSPVSSAATTATARTARWPPSAGRWA